MIAWLRWCSFLYRPQRSWAKVIFSEACVKNSVHGGGVCLSACWDTPPKTRHPPFTRLHPPRADTPSPEQTPPRIRSMSGRYASYWQNAFLFLLVFLPKLRRLLVNNMWLSMYGFSVNGSVGVYNCHSKDMYFQGFPARFAPFMNTLPQLIIWTCFKSKVDDLLKHRTSSMSCSFVAPDRFWKLLVSWTKVVNDSES